MPSPRRRRPRPNLADILTSNAVLYGLVALAVILACGAGGLLVSSIRGAHTSDATPSAATPLPTLALPPRWDGKERVNVLLLGVDERPWDPNWGAPRADAIILLTLDPQTMTGGAISLPRDLWVNLPGIGERKLNQAYSLGEAVYGAGQGPVLTAKVVGNLLQTPVHHYVVVNFQAFIAFVDAIHGIKIDVPQRMALDVFAADGRRYDYPLYPGVQVLRGDLALAYARNRSVGNDGDFGRMRRQQQVLEGVLERLKDPRILAELTVKAPLLAAQLKDSLKTDLSVGDALRLARLAAEVPRANIHQVVIDQRQATATFKWEQGVQVYALVPDETKILAARDEVFHPAPPPTPTPTLPPALVTPSPTPLPPDVREIVAAEAPRLLVQNGTTVNGLACRTATWLARRGFDQVETGNADGAYTKTLLVEYTPKPRTLAYLKALFGVEESQVLYRASAAPPADIVIILGARWASSGKVDGVPCGDK